MLRLGSRVKCHYSLSRLPISLVAIFNYITMNWVNVFVSFKLIAVSSFWCVALLTPFVQTVPLLRTIMTVQLGGFHAENRQSENLDMKDFGYWQLCQSEEYAICMFIYLIFMIPSQGYLCNYLNTTLTLL